MVDDGHERIRLEGAPPMLDVDNATAFLLDRGLNPDVSTIIDGDLTIRMPRSATATCGSKGPEARATSSSSPMTRTRGACATLRREASFRRFCEQEPAASGLSRCSCHE